MDIKEMRRYVWKRYPGTNWKEKVLNMHDNQIIAIYHSLIKRKVKKEEKECPNQQMRFW